MENNKQMQKAGNNSQQVQIGNATINVGITEKRAREIFQEMNEITRKNYTQDAFELAMKKISMFEELLMHKVEQVDGMLEAFRDPSFQLLLVEAQKRAAASDRESDFEMLTELLAHRVKQKDDRKIKASISKAVEIVDQIDDDALCGLTVSYAILHWGPQTGNISQGLKTMNGLLSSLCYRELPTGSDWVNHLDILDAVRVSSMGEFVKLSDFYANNWDGYICSGIQENSENHIKALKILHETNLPANWLVPHELNEGYVRLPVRDQYSIAEMTVPTFEHGEFVSYRAIVQQEVDALNKIWNLYSKDSAQKLKVKHAFIEKWDSYHTLSLIHTWWDTIPHSFTITPIGNVLAHANAQRYNSQIPSLNNQ